MTLVKKLTYANSTDHALELWLEPWAEKYMIPPKRTVDVIVQNGREDEFLEIDHCADFVVIHGPKIGVVYIYLDGKEMEQSPQT